MIILDIIIFIAGFVLGSLIMLHYLTSKAYEVKNVKFGMSNKIK